MSVACSQVYPSDGPKKPDLGDGLNKPAEITLYKIFKRDQNGEPTKNPAEQQKFFKKLQHTATKQNTEFINYDADRGIWKFRVDHFSRFCSPVRCACTPACHCSSIQDTFGKDQGSTCPLVCVLCLRSFIAKVPEFCIRFINLDMRSASHSKPCSALLQVWPV